MKILYTVSNVARMVNSLHELTRNFNQLLKAEMDAYWRRIIETFDFNNLSENWLEVKTFQQWSKLFLSVNMMASHPMNF